MAKKKPSLRTYKKVKQEARRKRRRKQAAEVVMKMTDTELAKLAGEPINDLIHSQARRTLAARLVTKRKQQRIKEKTVRKKTQEKKSESGSPPPVIGDFAQPDWWRDQ
jgi:hypothetical protein